jgi:homoserine dehydrogenase
MIDVQIGVIGLGQIGGALAAVLLEQRDAIARASGVRFHLKRVAVRDLGKKRGIALPPGVLTDRVEEVLEDPQVRIVVELMGGLQEARRVLLEAIERGKHVVTANKRVIAEHGHEILRRAKERRCWVGFEAAVCAGIPILNSLQNSLVGTPIRKLIGILNGTCNYILTRMAEEELSLEAALKQAQQSGFAEPDPADDLSGRDARSKAAILASMMFNQVVRPAEIVVEGIDGVTAEDIQAARRFGRVCRSIAVIVDGETEAEIRVHPAFLPERHPLASVREENNAIWIDSPLSGPLLFYGRGAGGGPTASALLGDLIDVAWHLDLFESAAPVWEPYGHRVLRKEEEMNCRNYLRFRVGDIPGVIGKVVSTLEDGGVRVVSVEALMGEGSDGGAGQVEVITDLASERLLHKAIRQLEGSPWAKGTARRIRLEP